MKRTKSFHSELIKALKDPAEAAAYLDAVLKEGDSTLLLAALRDVAEARGGMVQISRKTKLNRGNLYKILSKRGNPRLHSVKNILKAVGLRFSVVPEMSPDPGLGNYAPRT